jgi:hypothetical protein
MTLSQNRIVLGLLALFLSALFTDNAQAIPAFTREYNAECTTCHTVYPELNEYGEAFYKNGFVWSKKKQGTAAAAAAAPAAKGSEEISGEGDAELLALLKGSAAEAKGSGNPPDELKPKPSTKNEALWISGMPTTLPLSLAATWNMALDNSPGATRNKMDLSTRALSLLSGGVFRESIGFYVKYNMYLQGADQPSTSNTPVNDTPPRASDIEELYFNFRNVMHTPVYVKVGRFRPKLSIWKKSNKAVATDMSTTSYRVGANVFTLDAPQDAIELHGVLKDRFAFAVGIVDRNTQNNKEAYGHVSCRIGGTDFHGKEPEVDFDNESIWDYLGITLALYGYNGKNSQSGPVWNDYVRVGGDMDINYKTSRLRLSGVYGQDDNPFYDSWSNGPYRSKVLAAEFEQMLAVNIIGMVRAEYTDDGIGISHRYVPAIAYAPIENTKVSLEYQYQTGSIEDKKLILGLRFAF